MKKRKLEIKDIVGYFPYGMLFKADDNILRMDKMDNNNQVSVYNVWAMQHYIKDSGKNMSDSRETNDINYSYLSSKNLSGRGFQLNEIQPILHPMSDLTQHIIVKGYNEDKPFIPLIELAKFDTGNEGVKYTLEKNPDPAFEDYFVRVEIKGQKEPYIYFIQSDLRCIAASLCEFDFLNQWMFDYGDLIHDNLAIDIKFSKN